MWTHTPKPIATYDAPKTTGKILDKFIEQRLGQMWTKHKKGQEILAYDIGLLSIFL